MKRSRRLPCGEGDVEAELVELACEASGEAGPIDAVEVIDPEILVGNTALGCGAWSRWLVLRSRVA